MIPYSGNMTRSGFYLIIKVGRENTKSRNGVPTRPGVPTPALRCSGFVLGLIHQAFFYFILLWLMFTCPFLICFRVFAVEGVWRFVLRSRCRVCGPLGVCSAFASSRLRASGCMFCVRVFAFEGVWVCVPLSRFRV